MKSNRRLLRLGSFELLESRALLAHAGPPGMFAEGAFASAPHWQPDHRKEFSENGHSQHGGASFAAYQPVTDFRGGSEPFGDRPADGNGSRQSFQNEWTGTSRNRDIGHKDAYQSSAPSWTASSAVLAPVTTTVIVFITIPPPEAPLPRITANSPSLSPRESNSESSRPSSSPVSPPGNLNESFAPASSAPRGSGGANRTDVLTLTSSLLLRKSDSESASTEDNDEQNVDLTTKDRTDSADDQRRAAVQPTHEDAIQQSTDDKDDAELIELGEEDLFNAGKRKAPRKAAAVNQAAMRTENGKLSQSTLRNSPDIRPWETWRNAPEVEEKIAADDDLIELLAVEQFIPQLPAAEIRQFDSTTPHLQATLGYYQAVEVTPATVPTADSATVAAAALPAGAAK